MKKCHICNSENLDSMEKCAQCGFKFPIKQVEPISSKEIYKKAYLYYDSKKYNRLLKICAYLLKEYPDSKEAAWALKNFPIKWNSNKNLLSLNEYTMDIGNASLEESFLNEDPKSSEEDKLFSEKSHTETTSKRYSALFAYSRIICIFGWILFVFGSLAFVGGLLSRLRNFGFDSIHGLAGGIGIIVGGLGTVAMGQLICVWVDTEENTKKIVDLLEKNNK